jgi:hypothetical protein
MHGRFPRKNGRSCLQCVPIIVVRQKSFDERLQDDFYVTGKIDAVRNPARCAHGVILSN